jgi:hypothetical protein
LRFFFRDSQPYKIGDMFNHIRVYFLRHKDSNVIARSALALRDEANPNINTEIASGGRTLPSQ